MRLPSRVRPSTLIAVVAGLLIVAIAAVLISGGIGGTARPKQAKPFALAELGEAGKQVSLAAYAGRPVVLNFFASWCEPCQKETPLLAGFYRSHHGRVLVIGIDSYDQLSAAASFLRARGVTYPVAFDPSASVAVSYGMQVLPQTLFLNPRHQIVRHIFGALTEAELNSWAASISAGSTSLDAARDH
jgi:cytochrome c biogenesis protein CcmG/thiol:disulfide interchange protein DsbE